MFNTTLTALDICGKHNTWCTYDFHGMMCFFSRMFYCNQIMILETQEQHHWVNHWNQTPHSLNLIWDARQKKEATQKTSIDNSLFSLLFTSTANKIGKTGATSLSESLKSNTTLTKLNLNSEHKRKKTHKRHPSTIHSSACNTFNSQQNWRHRSNVIEWSIEIKHNTHWTQSGEWRQKERQKKTSINNSLFSPSL